ncbi:MAG: pyridoxamine 5'-phosphate oxidase family protein [Spirochaetaceae bacterium]|nr:pyridoxamine 5'-phosphate oxidase family protein [Spirochaetaceae bacterium]
MRRRDREITGAEEKLRIIDRCKVLRLGMAADNQPYVVPLNFGYRWEGGALTLYFHSAPEGRKLETLKKNPRVCFEMDDAQGLLEAEAACDYGYAYESVIGFGTLEFLEAPEEKAYGLRMLMKHQTGRDDFTFGEGQLEALRVYRVRAESFTAKRRPPPGDLNLTRK